MKRSLKIAVIATVIIVALIGLAIIAAEPVLNSSAVKSQIENVVSDALDMRFRIEGRIKLSFWPLLSVVANHLSVSTSQGKIASADRIEIDPRLPDLISLKVHLDDVHIQNPKLTFDPHAIDKILALAARRTDAPLPLESLVIESFSISDAGFYYSDDQSVVDMDDMDFDGGRIVIIENREVAINGVISFFQAVNFKGEVSARQISSPDFQLTDIKAQVKDNKGVLTFDPIELVYLGSGARLRATLDLTKEKPFIESHISISDLKIGTLAQKFSQDYGIRGNANVAANISGGPIDTDRIFRRTPGKDDRRTPASNSSYPVRSFHIKAFSVAATEVAYSKGKTSVQIPRFNLAGDQLTVIEDSRLRINDFKSLIALTNYKVDTDIKRIFAEGHEIRDVRMNFKIDNGNLIADGIHMNYLGSKTKIAGRIDLLHKLPNAQMRIESSASDIRSLAARILPDVDIGGGLKVDADIIATGVQVNHLIKRLQAISNSDRPVEEVYPVNQVEINSINVSGSSIKFTEGITKLDNAKIKLTGGRMRVIEKNKLIINNLEALWQKTRFDANIQNLDLSVGDEKLNNIKSTVRGDHGFLKSDLIELDYFGARTKVAGILNMQDSLKQLKVRIEMPEVDLKKSFDKPGEPDILEGVVSIHAEFEGRAAYFNEILKNMNGDFSIKGQDLILIGADLDKALSEFKNMSGYGFNDFSALVLLGPLGAVVSHGYDQLEALEKIMAATGDSTIKQVVSDWNVAAGVLTAKDVAFSTKRNRVAVKGSLDLTNKKFNNVVIAIVDPQGCIVNSETVNGPFAKPEIKDAGVIKRTVVRPLIRFLKTKCDFFYDGSVPHPTGGQTSGDHQ